ELPTSRIEPLERGQLSQTHTRSHVREVGLAAGKERVHRILRGLALTVKAMELELTHFLGRAADDAAPLYGVHVLVGMEAEADEIAEAADTLAAPGRADRLGGILDDPQPVAAGNRIQPIHVHRQTGKVDRHDRARARRYGGLHLVEIDVTGVEADI